MNRNFLVIVLFVLLLSACATAVPTPSVSTEPGNNISVSSSPQGATATPSQPPVVPTPQPTPTATLVPLTTFEKENYRLFTGTVDFIPVIAQALKQPSEKLIYVDFAVTKSGSLFAVYGCINNCTPDAGGKFFLAFLDLDNPSNIRVVELSQRAAIRDMAFDPAGDFLYYSIGREVLRYDLATSNPSKIYTTNESESFAFIGISPDGKLLAIENLVSLKILSLQDNTVIKTFTGTFFGNRQSPQFSADGRLLMVPTADTLSEITVYDTSTWEPLGTFETPGMRASAISPDGTLMAQIYNEPAVVKFVDIASGAELRSIPLPFQRVNRAAFNPSGTLLVVTGSPDDTAYLEDNIQVIDVASGLLLDPIPSWIEPYGIWFTEDGESILFTDFSTAMLEKWSLPNADIRAAHDFFVEYFDAITAGDYAKAAQMSALDPLDVDEVQKRGLDPSNLAEAFAVLCAPDEVPCLPPGDTLFVKATKLWGWDYSALVTITQPDGSTYLFDGLTPYYLMGIKRDAQGNMKINTLHPGMYYPY